MTPFVWASIGMSIGAAVLHSALGLRRPIRATYLSFAGLMVLLAVFLHYELEIYRAMTVDAAVEAMRRQIVVVYGFVACTLVFIPAYTQVRIPRLLLLAYASALPVLLVANALAPYGIWFSGPPELHRAAFLDEPYSALVAPPLGISQFAHVTFFTSVVVLALVCAIKLARRGERQRGLALAFGLAAILVATLVDYARDAVGAAWPYMSEFGIVSWALIMSVQLAHDFRVKAQALARAITDLETQSKRLTSMLGALRALEDNMVEPLHTLEMGVAALADGRATQDAELLRLQRAVARLREFSRSMPDISARPDGSTTGVRA